MGWNRPNMPAGERGMLGLRTGKILVLYLRSLSLGGEVAAIDRIDYFRHLYCLIRSGALLATSVDLWLDRCAYCHMGIDERNDFRS